MALNFPASPENGNVFVSGGITYVYNATKEVWVVDDTRAAATVYVSNVAPSPAIAGDLYWDTETGRMYVYYNDGDTSQWVEATNLTGTFPTLDTDDVAEGSNLYFSNSRVQNYLEAVGNITPASDEVYSLGTIDNRWKDLYLSGNTLVLGSIALKDSNGTFTTTTVESNGYIIPSETPVGTGAGGSVSPAKNIIFSMVFGGMQ